MGWRAVTTCGRPPHLRVDSAGVSPSRAKHTGRVDSHATSPMYYDSTRICPHFGSTATGSTSGWEVWWLRPGFPTWSRFDQYHWHKTAYGCSVGLTRMVAAHHLVLQRSQSCRKESFKQGGAGLLLGPPHPSSEAPPLAVLRTFPVGLDFGFATSALLEVPPCCNHRVATSCNHRVAIQ